MSPNLMSKFCGNDWEVWRDDLDITDCEEASGLAVSTHNKYIYMANDSPEDKSYIFCYEKANPKNRTVIEVTGIANPHFNGGYGDWEALAVSTHPQNPKMKCIVIADIGHNRARVEQGKFRTDEQQTRLIYVEEPTEQEFKKSVGKIIQKPGVEFPFQYTDKNLKHDAEAIAIVDDNVMVITKNNRSGDKRCYVYCAHNQNLKPNELNVFALVGQLMCEFSEVTDAFATPHLLVLRTYVGINFYAMSDLNPGKDAPIRGCHKLQELRDRGQQEAIAYDSVDKKIFLIGEGSKEMFSIAFDADTTTFGNVALPLVAKCAGGARVSTASGLVNSRELPSQLTQEDRPRYLGRREPLLSKPKGDGKGKGKGRTDVIMKKCKPDLVQRDIDIQWLHRASGMCISSDSRYFYVVDESPGPLPYIFIYDRSSSSRRIILEIKGIQPNGYLPRKGCGHGAWQSMCVGPHPTDPSKRCIIIGDIGNNMGFAGKRPLRSDDQPTRLIYVDEPSTSDLDTNDGRNLSQQGTEYIFQYGERNEKFDSEALCVVNDHVLIITRNKDINKPTAKSKKSMVYRHSNSGLEANTIHTFDCIGEINIEFSEVTDAFCTEKLLGLRTYLGVNFYALNDIQPGKDVLIRGVVICEDMKSLGLQEALTYDPESKLIYFLGQGSTEIYACNFDAEQASATWEPIAEGRSNKGSRGTTSRGKKEILDKKYENTKDALPPLDPKYEKKAESRRTEGKGKGLTRADSISSKGGNAGAKGKGKRSSAASVRGSSVGPSGKGGKSSKGRNKASKGGDKGSDKGSKGGDKGSKGGDKGSKGGDKGGDKGSKGDQSSERGKGSDRSRGSDGSPSSARGKGKGKGKE